MEKILRVNMSGLKIDEEDIPSDLLLYGGRGLTSSIVDREVPPRCDPLSPENKVIVACGLLAATAASTANRVSVGTKSPLTGGIKESNSGGAAGYSLGRLGIRAIILEGSAESGTWVLIVKKDGARLERRDDLQLKRSYAAVEELRKSYGANAAIVMIGPAGERMMHASSTIITDTEGRPTRHCGRGGTGAVLGSKRLKAIVLDHSGCGSPFIKNAENFKENAGRFNRAIRNHPVSENLRAFGTNVLANIINEQGAYPTRNFASGRFDKTKKISGETLREVIIKRGGKTDHACQPGCLIRCSNEYRDRDGKLIASGLEYESIWANGANCEIDDLDTIATLDHLYDELGLDSIEMGVTLGVAMHAGLIPFGDGKAAIGLVSQIGENTEIGRVLGQGAKISGEYLKCDRIPVVKGQGLPAYDPRGIKGMGVTYATSPMGADHTAGYCVATSVLSCGGEADPLSVEGKLDMSRNLQIATALIDNINICLFTAFAVLDNAEVLESLVGMTNAKYGCETKLDDLLEIGREILRRERRFNRSAGFTEKDDRLPAFFTKKKLPPHNHTFDIPERELDTVFNF